MPWLISCSEHVGWRAELPLDADEHARSQHGGRSLENLTARGVVVLRFVSQAEAQGGAELHSFRCRVCAELVDTIDAERAREPYCDQHRETPTLSA